MLFRIWIWACSDMGSTAPTNFPDSISISEGIPSPDNFSLLLRKLAKDDLLVESFSACSSRYLSRTLHGQASNSPQNDIRRMPSDTHTIYPIVFNEITAELIQIGEGGALQDKETRPH